MDGTLQPSFGITARTRFKHAAVLRAVRKCGGLAAFAEKIGVSRTIAMKMQNLQWCLPSTPRPYWTQERIDNVKRVVSELTGENAEDLFPDELRKSVELGLLSKTVEQTRQIPLAKLIAYTRSRKQALTLPSPADTAEETELRDTISNLLHSLDARERTIIEMRYGLGVHDGKEHAIGEVGSVLNITRERVRQLESRAIRKLQDAKRSSRLIGFVT